MRILEQLNIPKQCKKYGAFPLAMPLFFIFDNGNNYCFGFILSYLIGTRYIAEPRIVALIVLIISAILFILLPSLQFL
jgi:hypothetical protein